MAKDDESEFVTDLSHSMRSPMWPRSLLFLQWRNGRVTRKMLQHHIDEMEHRHERTLDENRWLKAMKKDLVAHDAQFTVRKRSA